MSPKLRLVVLGGLFFLWIGYLAYLVAVTRDPIFVSRPQLLAANLFVRARLQGSEQPEAKVRVQEVIHPREPALLALEGTELSIDNLDRCWEASGWRGPGDYLLPLRKVGQEYFLAEIPPSPGYALPPLPQRLRIYLATEDTRRQLEDYLTTLE